jgi:cytochrome c-type protein NapC
MSVFGMIALACSAIASLILVVYLIKRPALSLNVKLWLLLGLGVLPIGTAVSGNVAGMEASKEVTFCNGCHVMRAHTGNAWDLDSQSLASRHTRNELFGHESCYVCHADYGMFGTLFTKLGGMGHVLEYVKEFHEYSLEDALPKIYAIHQKKPMPNRNCQHCHSGTNKLWLQVPSHASAKAELASGRISCGSSGCHGYAHPFSKPGASALPDWLKPNDAPAGPAHHRETQP